MTQAKTKFASFEEYLETSEGLPEGYYEYVDGELVELMTESGQNDEIANFLFAMFLNTGLVPLKLLRPHSCEVEVPGRPRTRFPDLVILRDEHPALLKRRNTITRQMPPPRIIIEVVSSGEQNRERDLIAKRHQYAEIGVPEYWLVDPECQIVTLLQWVNGQYIEHGIFKEHDRINSPTFGELLLTAAQILTAGE